MTVRITLELAHALRPGRERWAWRVWCWYADNPEYVIDQGVAEGIDAAWEAARAVQAELGA